MIASDWPFGLQKCARLTYGQARLTLGHYLRVEEEGNEQMKKTWLQTEEKNKLLPELGLSNPISSA